MALSNDTHFFLGANTSGGFFSLYERFVDTSGGDFLYILKGGPGCGKSTFMKTIAAELKKDGIDAEFIHCSGDPDSLDGVYFPALHLAFADGTAPHVMDPDFAGVSGAYINIGDVYDTDSLRLLLPQIKENTAAYKAYYTKAYAYLSGASSVTSRFTSALMTESVQKSIIRRAAGISAREFARTGKTDGTIKYRFISAISCDGYITRFDTVKALAARVYALDNEYGLAPFMLSLLTERAVSRGYDVTVCLSPLDPEIPEHIIIPELSLAFVSRTASMPYPYETVRHIRLDSLPDSETVRNLRPKLRRGKKIYNMLIDEALSCLTDAGNLHDDLEAIYNPFVDFEKLHEMIEEYLYKIRKK